MVGAQLTAHHFQVWRCREQPVEGPPVLETMVTAAHSEGRGKKNFRLDFLLTVRYDGRVCSRRVQI